MTTLSRLIATLRRLDQEASAGLLPCPFCGSENISVSYAGQPATTVFASCMNCGACGPALPPDTATGSHFSNPLPAWNARANLAPSLAEMLEVAERALRAMAEDSGAPLSIQRKADQQTATAALAELERLAGPQIK